MTFVPFKERMALAIREAVSSWFSERSSWYRFRMLSSQNLVRSISVSYTHLDVYKRQALQCLLAKILNLPENIRGGKRKRPAAERFSGSGASFYGVYEVSNIYRLPERVPVLERFVLRLRGRVWEL